MKTIQLLGILWAFNFGHSFAQSALTTFNIRAHSPNISEVGIYQYDFAQEKMKELKSFSGLIGVKTFSLEFTEPSIYQVRLDNGQQMRIAVEKAGVINLKWNGSIEMVSEVATESDFGKTIEDLNHRFFSDLKEDYDKAIREGNQSKLAKLEVIKDELLVDFVLAMEQEVRAMGPSAAAFDALAYFDLHKNFAFLQEMTSLIESQFPHAGMTQSLQHSLARAAAVAEGSLAPKFTGRDLAGNQIELASFKGKYLLIDFWASWCRVCRVENPHLAKLRNQYLEKGFDILSISQDSEIAPYQKAMEKDGLTWSQIHDADRAITRLYLVSSLPSNFLLDPEGKIIAKNINAQQLKLRLDQLLIRTAQE